MPRRICDRARGWRRCTARSGWRPRCSSPAAATSRSTSCATNTPKRSCPTATRPASWLRRLTEEGLVRRFPSGVPPAVRATIEHELALIAQLQYEPYFLTVADLVHWARAQGILCQGRGSAANSAVCYALHVTEVDPARMSLLFERFISAERNEPPDIDIDFEHQRREEVIQYVYRKYGRAPRGADRRRHQLPPAQRAARRGPRAGHRPGAHRRRVASASTGSTAARSTPSACARTASTPTRRSAGCGSS